MSTSKETKTIARWFIFLDAVGIDKFRGNSNKGMALCTR
jgi:hypothetical protein